MVNSNIVEMRWHDARLLVASTNSRLANIIDAWSPPANYKLYKISYRFGDQILHNGIFYVPNQQGELLPIYHKDIPQEIGMNLTYRNIPLGVLTKNAQEVYLEHEDRVISLAYFKPGVILGLLESLDETNSLFPKSVWSICAGARSVFMLPKISEFGSHQKLCKAFGIHANVPKSMQEHQPLFVNIARQTKSEWRHEVIFFSKQWLVRDESNTGWLRFHHHLLEAGWALSEYNRNYISLDQIWESFARSLEKNHRKPSLYLLNTLQHILGISLGKIPGFQVAVTDESAGPIKLIQETYLRKYKLHQYYPTIIQPYHFDYLHGENVAYYSLQFPTCLETLPQNRAKNCLMDDIREFKNLMDHFIDESRKGKLKTFNTPIDIITNELEFHYIHSDKDVYGTLMLSENLDKIDKNFVDEEKSDNKKKLTSRAAFFRGCIAIKRKISSIKANYFS